MTSIPSQVRVSIEQAFARGEKRSQIMRHLNVDYQTVVAVWDAMQQLNTAPDGAEVAHSEMQRVYGPVRDLLRERRRVRYDAKHRRAA